MLGAIIGDIVGSIYEFNNTHDYHFELLTSMSEPMDDSFMSLAVARSLMESFGEDDETLKANLVKNMQAIGRQYPFGGYGIMFRQWLCAKNPKPYNSFGNGSAMRVASAGRLYRSLEETLHAAEITACVTHNHPEGIKGAQAIAAAVFFARAGATKEDIEASKQAMSSMEIILGEPSRLERLAVDIHDHYVEACANDPGRIQKAMIVCSSRPIAYDLLTKFQDNYPEWFEEKKHPDGITVSDTELNELSPMPFIAMVSSVGKNDEPEMYNYLGGVTNDKRSEKMDVAFKQEKSNFHIVIVVDMWITGFDVPSLTYLYNDKPLKKHMLIQTISRVNRKYPGKDYGMVIDYIGIRDNMREAMKIYGGDTSVAPTADDVEQATAVFREELVILKDLFSGYDIKPFLDPNCDPFERYKLLAKAAEFVFASSQEMNSVGNNGKSKSVSFKTYFLKIVKRMRAAFDICQPSGELGEEESALAQCFMAIAGFVRKMSGTSDVDADTMNRHVAKMVEEALKYSEVESVLEAGEQEDIFSPEYFEKLSDVKMPATKLELLVKMLRKQISEYGKVNQIAAKKFQEMLEKTIEEYHDRRKHLSTEEAGATQEQASEDIIKSATEQALSILREMNENKESFRKIGLTFEEKAFYDILIALRDEHNFEYGTDKDIDGIIVNDKCKALAKKVKEIIDTKSSFADWLNNQNVRDQLKLEIKICLVKNGYPPQYSPEVFGKVMEQVENFEENYDYVYSSSDNSQYMVENYKTNNDPGVSAVESLMKKIADANANSESKE